MIAQIGIMCFGLTAVFLVARKDKWQRFGYIAGLAGQPFWFYTTWQAEQWGIFILSFFYAWAWAKGIYNYWIKDYHRHKWHVEKLLNDPHQIIFTIRTCEKCQAREILLRFKGWKPWDVIYPNLQEYEREWLDKTVPIYSAAIPNFLTAAGQYPIGIGRPAGIPITAAGVRPWAGMMDEICIIVF